MMSKMLVIGTNLESHVRDCSRLLSARTYSLISVIHICIIPSAFNAVVNDSILETRQNIPTQVVKGFKPLNSLPTGLYKKAVNLEDFSAIMWPVVHLFDFFEDHSIFR